MRRLSLLFLLTALGFAGFAAEKPLTVSTTIDFLDYVFYDMPKGEAVYPLEHFEQRIAGMKAGGIDRIYLRVNVCGLTLYPSRVCSVYGEKGGFHRDESGRMHPSARQLIDTLAAYDPLAETIRLGKKHGLEVWAWESLWDDAATVLAVDERDPAFAESGRYPLMDPYFREHPEGYARRDPRLVLSEAAIAAARAKTVATIRLAARKTNRPNRLDGESIRIYTSADNRTYAPYTGPARFRFGRTADGRTSLVIDQLAIRAPYLKLVHAEPLPADHNYAFVLAGTGRNPDCRLFDPDGAEIPAAVGVRTAKEKAAPETVPVNFAGAGAFAWDYGDRQLGFALGGDEAGNRPYLLGYAEFAVPATMKHKLARFAELTKYPFDGFMFNLRSHSAVVNGEEYGYNPELRDLYRRRYGKDIWRDEIDRRLLNELRADALDGFLAGCKQAAARRPLAFSGVANDGKPCRNYMADFSKHLGLPWHYAKWFRAGIVDHIVMIGDDFVPELQAAAAGRAVGIGVFFEMAAEARAKFKDFPDALKKAAARPEITEVELYETLELSKHPEIYRAILEAKKLRTP